MQSKTRFKSIFPLSVVEFLKTGKCMPNWAVCTERQRSIAGDFYEKELSSAGNALSLEVYFFTGGRCWQDHCFPVVIMLLFHAIHATIGFRQKFFCVTTILREDGAPHAE